MQFYLGTHQPHWLGKTTAPLFVSRSTLMARMTLPRSLGPWALDSGAFSEITMRGRWTVTPQRYVADVRRFRSEIGRMDWAAIQDWMCEPVALRKTSRTVAQHQQLTVQSYLDLREIAPEVPWAPVLQGWASDDYRRHVDLYERYGVDLRALPIVGLGSVCRRSQTADIITLVTGLSGYGIRLHGFGVKTEGLKVIAGLLESSDSMAWSFGARRSQVRMSGCTSHINCANRIRYAMLWRSKILAIIDSTTGTSRMQDDARIIGRKRATSA